jgi:hypothetical protein
VPPPPPPIAEARSTFVAPEPPIETIAPPTPPMPIEEAPEEAAAEMLMPAASSSSPPSMPEPAVARSTAPLVDPPTADVTTDPPPLPRPSRPARPAVPRPLQPSPALDYSTPGDAYTAPVRARSTTAFLIVSLLLFLDGLVVAAVMYFVWAKPGVSDAGVLLSIGSTFAFLVLSVLALVLWLMWLHGVHKDLRAVTHGTYQPTAAQAVGYSFIPLLHIAWAIYVPAKLCGEVNRLLEERGMPKASKKLVLISQILSVIVPFVGLFGLTPLLYAVSMRQIQGGLNRLASPPA